MKTFRILILEDELEALQYLTKALNELEEKLFKKNIDIAVTIISEQKEAEELINTKAENDYDLILLDRDTKEGGSFHVLDLDKFKCEKIISISSDHKHNTTAIEMGIEKICYKDFERIEEWSNQVAFFVEQAINITFNTNSDSIESDSKKIYMGETENGERIELNFDEENIDFIALLGATGSGKSFFHYHLYEDIMNKYSHNEVGFVFMDMTKVDFYDWPKEYLATPVVHDVEEAILTLHEVADMETDKKIFIHIEECDMVAFERKGTEIALERIKERDNFYVIYSTSRIDREYLTDWMKKFINMKIVFHVPTADDYYYLLGKDADVLFRFKETGERILDFNGKHIYCQPFKNRSKLDDI